MQFLKNIIVILIVGLLSFAINIAISASPINFDQDHHIGSSETYTYDEIESSVFAEGDRTGGLSRVLSVKGVLQYHEILARELSEPAVCSLTCRCKSVAPTRC